jgi:hypothetical protein
LIGWRLIVVQNVELLELALISNPTGIESVGPPTP